MSSSSLGQQNNVHSLLYLWLFFRFPNYFYARIKHNMVKTTITNDCLVKALILFYKDSTKSGRDKCMGHLLPGTGAVKKGAGSLLRCMQTGFVIDRVAYWFIAQMDRFLSESDPKVPPTQLRTFLLSPIETHVIHRRQYIRENEWVSM